MEHVFRVVVSYKRVLLHVILMKFSLEVVSTIQEMMWTLVDRMTIHGKQEVLPTAKILPSLKPMLNVRN
jgi:hypothetical protein